MSSELMHLIFLNQTLAIKYCNNFIGRLLELLELLGKFHDYLIMEKSIYCQYFPPHSVPKGKGIKLLQ
jgi:hypothetical protein